MRTSFKIKSSKAKVTMQINSRVDDETWLMWHTFQHMSPWSGHTVSSYRRPYTIALPHEVSISTLGRPTLCSLHCSSSIYHSFFSFFFIFNVRQSYWARYSHRLDVCPSVPVCPSVCPSVRHTLVLYRYG